jgi:transposase
MAKLLKYAIGLDMAKDKFDACLAVIDDDQNVIIKSSKANILNTKKGFNELLVWVNKHCVLDCQKVFCLEATGIYYEHLAWYLHQQGCLVSVLLPNKARNYMRSLGIKTKNDKIDAKGLSMMSAQQQMKQWRPISNQIYELRQLTRFYQKLQETRTMLRNQLQTLVFGRLENDAVANGMKSLIDSVETQIKEIAFAIEQKLKNDPALWKKAEDINTIKGLGLISIATVIAETDGFALFESLAQLVSYAGYDVVQNQSGKREGKTRISKMGNNRVRRILFMPAFNVVKYKVAPFVNLYTRIYERTKIKMKAYVAVQRKLLILMYTLWKKDEKFRIEMHSEMGTRMLSFR